MMESVEHQGTTVYISLDTKAPEQDNLCAARKPVVVPNGINPILVGLSDVLPASVFDVLEISL